MLTIKSVAVFLSTCWLHDSWMGLGVATREATVKELAIESVNSPGLKTLLAKAHSTLSTGRCHN